MPHYRYDVIQKCRGAGAQFRNYLKSERLLFVIQMAHQKAIATEKSQSSSVGQEDESAEDLRQQTARYQLENKKKLDMLETKRKENIELLARVKERQQELQEDRVKVARIESLITIGGKKVQQFTEGVVKWKDFLGDSRQSLDEVLTGISTLQKHKEAIRKPAREQVKELREKYRGFNQTYKWRTVLSELEPLNTKKEAVFANRSDSENKMNDLCGRFDAICLKSGTLKEKAPVRRKTRQFLLTRTQMQKRELRKEVMTLMMQRRAMEVELRQSDQG